MMKNSEEVRFILDAGSIEILKGNTSHNNYQKNSSIIAVPFLLIMQINYMAKKLIMHDYFCIVNPRVAIEEPLMDNRSYSCS